MRISSVQGILEMPNGTKLEAVRGTILKVYPRKDGTNDHGEWSFQDCDFKDRTGTIKMSLKDRPAIGQDWVGATVLIEAGDHKGKLTGIEVEDREHNSKTTRRIKVTASATFADGTEVVDHNPDSPPQGNRSAPPPGGGKRPPAPDLAAEERYEQEQARPARQQQQAPAQQQRASGPPAGSEPTTEQKVLAAKRELLELTTLYTMSHDAAVLHAASVFSRHGHTMPPEAIGALATTIFIEANKRCIRPPAMLSTQMPAPKFKLSDFLADRPAPAPAEPVTTEELAKMPEHTW